MRSIRTYGHQGVILFTGSDRLSESGSFSIARKTANRKSEIPHTDNVDSHMEDKPAPDSGGFRVSFGHIEIGPTARGYLEESLRRNWISEGPNVRLFEERFAKHFGFGHAVATSSGTDAAIVACSALHELGAKRGDEIITPALSFVSTANAVLAAGLTPRFVDIDLETLNVDPRAVEKAIDSSQTAAIQVVHTMGRPSAMDDILAIAENARLAVIEDCCEAHGARLNGRFVGSMGTVGLFSFYTAHLICSGEGGMIVTDSDEVARLTRSIRSHGRRGGELYFAFDRVGYNSKMNDLEAAIGLEGIENFDETFTKRRHLYERLCELLEPLEEHLILFRDGPAEVIAPHAFPIVLRDESKDVAGLYRYLENAGIQCKTLFGSLPTQHRAFGFLDYEPGDFPVAERVGRTGLHFGMHQYLTEEDVSFIADVLHSYFSSGENG